ncbi:uncharacterized protein LOC119990501 [Tripterygium wilfordii]|uniref:uncharacterized protein LOC119990501 n=1 Tax=Tripterygium wilfordii TaxID=458696 RepID=UPI0018F8346A|nr:uncharacterized protein LOC119990501 [Tripterygium wilfordii]
MKRIKNSISEDLSSMGHLEKFGAPHMFHKLNLPFQTENCLRNVVNEWDKVQVSLKIMDSGIAEKCHEVKRTKEKRASLIANGMTKFLALVSVQVVIFGLSYQIGRLAS